MLRRLAIVTVLFLCSMQSFALAANLTPETTAMRVPAIGTPRSVAILVIDNRPFVLDGDKPENFAGIVRKVYGIPVSRTTPDKSAVATFLGERLRIGFDRAGYAAVYLPSRKGSLAEDRLRDPETGHPDLFFVLSLEDWRYDHGGLQPTFYYDVGVAIYDSNRHLLGGREVRGTEPGPIGGLRLSEERYAQLYQKIFDSIFDLPGVSKALGGNAPEAEDSMEPIEGRLAHLRRLFEDGLIDEQTYKREQSRILSEL